MVIHNPKVYIIVLNWNGESDTCNCIESLLNLTYANYEIVVCDNNSTDSSLQYIRNWATNLPRSATQRDNLAEITAEEATSSESSPSESPVIQLIHTGGNLGFAGGMNVGIEYARSRGDMDYCWILNNDTVVETSALTELVSRTSLDPTIGICGSSLIYYSDRAKVQAYGGAKYIAWRARSIALGAFSNVESIPNDPTAVEKSMSYVVGASMLVARKFIDKIGLMDETYFLYSEEHDWAHRGVNAGFRLAYAPKSFIYHKHGATIGTSPHGGSTKSLYFLYRSKLLFAKRHTRILLPSVVCWLFWDALKLLLKGYPLKAIAVMHGLRAAIYDTPIRSQD